MDQSRPNPNRYVPRSTPFPNILIEKVMPKIGDTEWRVLTVVVRATLGWIDPVTGYRKNRSWITSGELRRRTGRSSSAISLAVDRLVKSNLLDVTDSRGTVLSTAAARRRAMGRLYYGLRLDLLKLIHAN